ncbi:unnamed protein product [Bodo saltans]|uniref:Tc1-like transposase DDE domain-containing protein n=1 Tax=Bodo saltans TaxID=75058 RepID=A0A0S4IKY9_BODSA|nr:unnamed protein product [Bodo saltans]|eukprot:CUE69847.1 unnamed protein product [Bodo saltans]
MSEREPPGRTESPDPSPPRRPPGRPKRKVTRPKRIALRDEERQGAIVALRAIGKSANDIAAMVGVSERTVRRGGFKVRQEHPKKEVVSPPVRERRKRVMRALKKRPRSNSQDIANVIGEATGETPTKRTVARDLRALGVRHLTCDRVQKLTPEQKKKRLEFSKKMLALYPEHDAFWSGIVFSDESMRGRSDMDSTCWVAPGEERLKREIARWDCKIHVWGYIGTDGVRCIRRIDGETVTGPGYLTRLKETIGKRQWKNRTWQQDNAPAHTAKIVKEFLGRNFPTWIADWPPCSPDLSPIENLWGRLWVDALKNRPTTSATLWDAVQKTFLAYDKSYFDTLVLSFRRRLVMCVEKEGDTIGSRY